MLRTQLSIFDANRSAEGIPQVDDVGNDDALALLRRDLLRQQGGAKASLDARDLRLDARAKAVAEFLVERINTLFLDVFDELVMPARLSVTVYDRVSRRWYDRRDTRPGQRFAALDTV